MGWKDLDFRERTSLMTSAIQAAATFGMFLVAVIGIWKVTPIITYQVEKQASDLSQIAVEPHTHPLVIDALSWWGSHMQSYDRLIEILKEVVHDLDTERVSQEEFDHFSFTWQAVDTLLRDRSAPESR